MEDLAIRTIEIEAFPAVTMGFIVYFLGAFLTRHISVLRNYNIPEPVSGGLTVALVTLIFYSWFNIEIVFDLAVRDKLLIIFFTAIGLNARFSDLRVGGKLLLTLLMLTITFMILQNVVALIGVSVFDLPKGMSVLIGSASLIGGHGTTIAWGPTIESLTGFHAAAEIGIAAATLGLVFAALIGGPIAKYLIDKHGLSATSTDHMVVGMPFETEDNKEDINDKVDHVNIMRALLAAYIAIILGHALHKWMASIGMKVPEFLPCMLIAILMSNTIPYIFPKLPWPAKTRSLAIISDYCLSVFLAMSLMSMKLWTLAGLGGTLVSILLLQVLAATLFIIFIVYRFMGSDYTSGVLCAGFAGFALGATPTAIANMSSVTKRYGPAPLALIILPLVSAFFVDIANSFIIKYFIGL